MTAEPLKERMDRWIDQCAFDHIPLKRILIHPDDAFGAPSYYRGLPVVVMGSK